MNNMFYIKMKDNYYNTSNIKYIQYINIIIEHIFITKNHIIAVLKTIIIYIILIVSNHRIQPWEFNSDLRLY